MYFYADEIQGLIHMENEVHSINRDLRGKVLNSTQRMKQRRIEFMSCRIECDEQN